MNEIDTGATGAASYTMGYNEEFQQLLRRRSAESSAAYLLPHLAPGQRLLDFGCGPGTISVGLARAIEPGELHGIDMEASQIEIARAAASAGGHENAAFQASDAAELPFEDGYFDVAHCHAVLTHVPDTLAALAEVRRVLKPGGLLASRELICASSFFEPGDDGLNGGWITFANLLEANGGHPQMGKQLKRVFLDAGFEDIHTSLTFEHFGSAEDVAFFHAFATDWFCSPATIEAAVEHGLETRQQFEDWRGDLARWKDEPGAIAAMGWGEALGRKP